jgi:hypothetical protein
MFKYRVRKHSAVVGLIAALQIFILNFELDAFAKPPKSSGVSKDSIAPKIAGMIAAAKSEIEKSSDREAALRAIKRLDVKLSEFFEAAAGEGAGNAPSVDDVVSATAIQTFLRVFDDKRANGQNCKDLRTSVAVLSDPQGRNGASLPPEARAVQGLIEGVCSK